MKKPRITQKFKLEYNCWRNAVQRSRGPGYSLSPEFKTFKSFLDVMGPKPSTSHTLDRIDSDLKVYGHSTCRWASKAEQSANRSNTLKLSFQGKLVPLVEVARLTGQLPDTMRRRMGRNWSNDEIIHGRSPSKKVKTRKQQGKDASIPELMYRQVYEAPRNGWEWLKVEPTFYQFWRTLYVEGLTKRFPRKHVSPAEFVLNVSSELLEKMKNGGAAALSDLRASKIVMNTPNFRLGTFRQRLIETESSAFSELARKEYKYDPLVLMQHDADAKAANASGPVCSTPWFIADESISYAHQHRLVKGFRKPGRVTPKLLALYMDTKGSPLLKHRKNPIMKIQSPVRSGHIGSTPFWGSRKPIS